MVDERWLGQGRPPFHASRSARIVFVQEYSYVM